MAIIKYRDAQSNLKISNEVIATVARCAAKEIEGVDSFTTASIDFRQLLLHGRTPKAIAVEIIDSMAFIDINLVVKYGYRITQLAADVQNAVKTAVQSMTGVRVAKVNVHVADVAFADND